MNLADYYDESYEIDFTDVRIKDMRNHNQVNINIFKFNEKIQDIKDSLIGEAHKAGGYISNEYFEAANINELIETCVRNNITITFKHTKRKK